MTEKGMTEKGMTDGKSSGTGNEQPTQDSDSNPNASGADGLAGDMGVSSERVGPTGPGQVGTDGSRDVAPSDAVSDAEPDVTVPPEQSPGGEEVHPRDDRAPKAGYPSDDPRSQDASYDAPPMV